MSLENTDVLKQRLITFGLSNSESIIYMYLLELGKESGGSSIAIATKLHRQYVYNALPRLIDIGLVKEVPKGKQNKYAANPPIALEKLGRKQAVAATDLARDLSAISNIGNEQEFEVIQGAKSVLEFEFDYIHSSKGNYEELIIGGSSGGFTKMMGDSLEEYLAIKDEKNILVKYLGSESEKDEYLRTIGTHYNQIFRCLKQLPDGIANMVIRPKAVCFYSYAQPPHIYVVKSEIVAEHYRNFFGMLWEMGVEPKQ